jgi:DNA-directed RNA polymerase subunit M/transcription elongation factor TFIIS
MPQSAELTPFAQQALANEVRSRGLKAEVETEVEDEKPPASLARSSFKPRAFEHESPKFRDSAGDDSPEADSSDEGDLQDEDLYDEDRKLVELCTVWSARDALQLQTILEGAGIPFFIGPERATSVDRVTSNFSNGVSVQIMQIGMPWARSAMVHYEPEDDQTPKDPAEPDEVPVRCPQCHSTEVVFEGLTSEPAMATPDPSQKYQWSCDSCGHQWEDDGVAKEE